MVVLTSVVVVVVVAVVVVWLFHSPMTRVDVF